MTVYRDDPAAIRALVGEDRVHRDLYLSDELFALEQEHFFANTWNYLGHASQVPNAGDYLTLDLAGRPLMMLRQADASIRVLYNRCAHKGTQLFSDACGNTGKFIRCPYHAWTYRIDGAPLSMPLKGGYEGTRLAECANGRGLATVPGVRVYRDFVFVRLNAEGPSFDDYFGQSLGAIDNMVDRSPRS
ncbi:MAG: Rieske 2Fe-2S domain-containing protein [Burkholderiaceae bacterium]